jgi:hypothetical protein
MLILMPVNDAALLFCNTATSESLGAPAEAVKVIGEGDNVTPVGPPVVTALVSGIVCGDPVALSEIESVAE